MITVTGYYLEITIDLLLCVNISLPPATGRLKPENLAKRGLVNTPEFKAAEASRRKKARLEKKLAAEKLEA